MTPRLAVTQEQAEDIASAFAMKRAWAPVTLRLPERPTMPYDDPSPLRYHDFRPIDVPIPEGTRVQVGWWELSPSANPNDWPTDPWRPVAFATLTEAAPTGTGLGLNNQWSVTLSDIKPVEADQ